MDCRAIASLVCLSGFLHFHVLLAERPASNPFLKKAQVSLSSAEMERHVGSYAMPSGVLFKVVRQGDRLLAGDPPFEILPQTDSEFASNRIFAQIMFQSGPEDQPSARVTLRAAGMDTQGKRVESGEATDPTRLIDAGGHRLRMLVTGRTGPTIVIEDGFGSSILMRSRIQADLSSFARVVTYDHAGTGGSERGPEPRDAVRVAAELRNALRNAALEPPYVLVGGSIGADYIVVFADRYPADVAGLVLLDPTPDWQSLLKWTSREAPDRLEATTAMVRVANRSASEIMKLQEFGRRAEWKVLEETRRQARRALPLRDLPIVQITGAAAGSGDKVAFFEAWLRENLPSAKHVLAKKSGHAVYAKEPQLVVKEIRRLVERTRKSRSE